MCAGWADADNHNSPTVSAEREFEQTRQFGVSVRDVILPAHVAERVDATSQRQKRLIDIRALSEPLSAVFGCTCSFTSSQVDNAQRSHGMGLVHICIPILLRDVDLKYCV